MGYKLKKNTLIAIANYVLANANVHSEEVLISIFYEMLMDVFNNDDSADTPNNDTHIDDIHIDSDSETDIMNICYETDSNQDTDNNKINEMDEESETSIEL